MSGIAVMPAQADIQNFSAMAVALGPAFAQNALQLWC